MPGRDNPNKSLKVLAMIAEDMESDAKFYAGKEFNGKNVAEYNGKQGAAIAALANIIAKHIKEEHNG